MAEGIVGSIILVLMGLVSHWLHNLPAYPTMENPKVKSGWQRFLDFVEQPLFLAPVGIIGGIVGVIFYAPVCLLCDVCVLLALHRSRAVSDKSPIIQAGWYGALFVVMTAILLWIGIGIRSEAGRFTNNLARAVAEYIKPQPIAGPETSRQTPQQSSTPKQPAPAEGKTHRPTKEKSAPPVSGAFANWLTALKNPPTMNDVFTNDFPNTMKLSDEGEFHWKDIAAVTRLRRQLYLDFPANSKFVGFYIPTTDPSDLSRTAEICLKLAHIDAVKQVLDELPKKTFIAAGLGQTTTIQDLTFSGRVVIYHDDLLSITQQADIIRAFAERRYAVGFFGPSDFGKTLSSWHHLHDAKGIPQ